MTKRAPSILSISYDESLLRTREWILQGAGFNVTSAVGFTDASFHIRNNAFDLVIIGHSLPKADKAALIEHVKAHNQTRILSLRRPGDEQVAGVDHSAEPLSAGALLEAVRTVLGKEDESTSPELTFA